MNARSPDFNAVATLMSSAQAAQIQAQAQSFVDAAVRDLDASVRVNCPEYLESLGLAQRWCSLIHKNDPQKISHAKDVAVGMYRILRYLGGDESDGRLGLIVGLIHEIHMPYSALWKSNEDIAVRFSPFVLDVIKNVTWKGRNGDTPEEYLHFMDYVGKLTGNHGIGMSENADLWSWVFTSVHEQLIGLSLQGQVSPEYNEARQTAIALMNERIRRRLVDGDESFLTLDRFLCTSPLASSISDRRHTPPAPAPQTHSPSV